MNLSLAYPNGLPIHRLTEEETNRTIELLRDMTCKYQCESQLELYFFPLRKWPKYIKNIIYCRRINYRERMLVVAFFVGNGATIPIMLVLLLRLCAYPFDIFKVIDLHRWFSDVNNRERNMYYYYDIILGKSYYFNGVLRPSRSFRGDNGASAVFSKNGHFRYCQ